MAVHRNTSSSFIVAEEVNGSHVLKIDGYSRTKELRENGKYVKSAQFCVGDHSWIIRYYPNGDTKEAADSISVFLDIDSAVAKDVKAKFRFKLLVKNETPVSPYSFNSPLRTFSSKGSSWGCRKFITKEALERSPHLKDDCFTIRCDITVMKEIRSECTTDVQFVVVPPSNLRQHFGDLLNSMDGTDVIFEVGHEIFSAHRCVLAARSTVFKAEFFGSMKARTCQTSIKISDMESEVFKSLIHFIYKDSLPEMTDEGSNDVGISVTMAQHLLVAADRYNIERLKLLCEEK